MAGKDGKILIVDDDEDILVAGKLLLKRHYGTVVTCNKPEHIEELMAAHDFDAILLDMNFGPGESSGDQGFFWLARILEIDPQAVVVMITAHGGVGVAVDAMKKGATDFIAKPWQNEKVVATLSASVKLRRSRSEAEELKKTNRTLVKAVSEPKQPILGASRAMQDVMSMVERSAPTDANVLILGENGTGKELIARELHSRSLRADKVFMSVDLGAVTESLFESELFGHKKGAFTDARDDRVGRLQAAHGGTLFLDEIGNLPLHLQAKLLTVLEQRKVTPVGSDRAFPIDVRVIAATNVPMGKLRTKTCSDRICSSVSTPWKLPCRPCGHGRTISRRSLIFMSHNMRASTGEAQSGSRPPRSMPSRHTHGPATCVRSDTRLSGRLSCRKGICSNRRISSLTHSQTRPVT